MIVASEHSANNHLHHINNLSALHNHTPYWGLRGGRLHLRRKMQRNRTVTKDYSAPLA